MPVTALTSLDEYQETIKGENVTIIDFWATWNGPCRIISPAFEKMSDDPEFSGIQFYKVDADDQPDIVQQAGIRALPTFIAYKDGSKVDDLVGANPQALLNLVRECNA
ncbi:hypothetical protein N7456_008956 [Penicillium angulare]|uniref:Thioredoxin n=1 Tax=Penicillium angulare TaxID=116970 RepID=A0A9W9F3R9_9EURO|nr:hypothetical protein N7456_008956 [Penicillium angulare]